MSISVSQTAGMDTMWAYLSLYIILHKNSLIISGSLAGLLQKIVAYLKWSWVSFSAIPDPNTEILDSGVQDKAEWTWWVGSNYWIPKEFRKQPPPPPICHCDASVHLSSLASFLTEAPIAWGSQERSWDSGPRSGHYWLLKSQTQQSGVAYFRSGPGAVQVGRAT